jgi:F420 biosynthesis protein FbiB-like protein
VRNLLKIIKGRRSTRQFLPGKVPTQVIRELIEAARWAPSAHNAQPWRFLPLDGQEEKERLAEAMAGAYRRVLKKDGHPPAEIGNRVRKSALRLKAAPYLILACLCREDCRPFPDRRRNRLEEILAHQGIGAALQNILLLAASRGLGTCWISAPLFCPRAVRNALPLPQSWEPVAFIALGRPKAAKKQGRRRGLQAVLGARRKGSAS